MTADAAAYEKFHYPLTIREHHLDTFGHVNNATYLEILEEARWELITPRGFGLATIKATGLGHVILELHLKFINELTLRQDIIIESQLVSYERKIGVLRQDIFNADKELCFASTMTMGLMDMKARKLVLPTPEWLHAVGAA